MYVRSSWQKVTPFLMAFVFGLFVTSLFNFEELQLNTLADKVAPPLERQLVAPNLERNSIGSGSAWDKGEPFEEPAVEPTRVRLLTKPQPKYTDEARAMLIEGDVVLRVTFLASGTIGNVSPIRGLPYGLTERAILAAKGIKFKPATRNGQPHSVEMTVMYKFTIL